MEENGNNNVPHTNDDDEGTEEKKSKGLQVRFTQQDDDENEPEEEVYVIEEPAKKADLDLGPLLVQQREINSLKEQLGTVTREKDELYDQLLRKLADFNNFRKRMEKERQEYFHHATANLINELLPIVDNFEKALIQCGDKESTSYRGMELIYRQMREIFKRWGIIPIEAMGMQFDPNFHEAVNREENPEVEDNLIIEEYQKGYMLNDKLLRPSLVKVNVVKSPFDNGEVKDKEVGDNEESNRN